MYCARINAEPNYLIYSSYFSKMFTLSPRIDPPLIQRFRFFANKIKWTAVSMFATNFNDDRGCSVVRNCQNRNKPNDTNSETFLALWHCHYSTFRNIVSLFYVFEYVKPNGVSGISAYWHVIVTATTFSWWLLIIILIIRIEMKYKSIKTDFTLRSLQCIAYYVDGRTKMARNRGRV